MTIPPEVRKQAERAKQLIEEQQRQRAQESAQTSPTPPPPEEAAQMVLPDPAFSAQATPTDVASDSEDREPEATPLDELSAEPQQPELFPEQSQEQDPIAELREELRRANARYDTLRGKYDAETARLRHELETLREVIRNSINQQSNTAAASTTSATQSVSDTDIMEELRKEFGEIFDPETLRLVNRAMNLAIERTTRKLEQELTPVREEVTVARSRSLYAELARRLPDWEKQNTDPEFLQWLQGIDPLSGLSRQQLLSSAEQAGDVDRIVAIFRAFREMKAPQQATTVQQAARPATRARSPVRSQHQPRKIWTRAEIAEFNERSRRGLIPEAEKRRILEDITLASREGRIVN